MTFTVKVLPNKYLICRFQHDTVLPEWIYSQGFNSITKTKDEISVVTLQSDFIPKDIPCNIDWRILEVVGPLDFSLTGVIAGIAVILSEKKIPIFVISTYDTDYLLVKEKYLYASIKLLRANNYTILE